jgi:hypothetical protein
MSTGTVRIRRISALPQPAGSVKGFTKGEPRGLDAPFPACDLRAIGAACAGDL